MVFLISQFLFLLFALGGLMVWAGSDMPLAMREIAMNTRKSADGGSRYVLIKVLSVCMKILAVLVWVTGIVVVVVANTAGNGVGQFLRDGPRGF